jgi:tetratricopeptide (TPR) repeat protein
VVDTWELVSRGCAAYKAEEHAQAIQACQEALEFNPYDTATRCRLGGALLAAGRAAEARAHFAYGVEHQDEIGDEVIRSWCRRGLEEAELGQD